MVDWTILSPTFLTATLEWAGAVLIVHTTGRRQAVKNIATRTAQP